MDAVKAYEQVKLDVERIVNDGPHDMATMEPGDQWCQGDVRVIRLPEDFDVFKHCEPMKVVPVQLAPGTTIGSRHCLDSTEGVVAYKLKGATPLDGPVLLLSKSRSVTHPEHGDCVGLPPGKYAFPGQRVYAEEVRRVQD